MGYINVKINDSLEKKVRMKIAENNGKKGDLTKTIEKGLVLWLERSNEQA